MLPREHFVPDLNCALAKRVVVPSDGIYVDTRIVKRLHDLHPIIKLRSEDVFGGVAKNEVAVEEDELRLFIDGGFHLLSEDGLVDAVIIESWPSWQAVRTAISGHYELILLRTGEGGHS